MLNWNGVCKLADLVVLLKALADGTRFRMVSLLLSRDLCVGALARRLGLSDAAVSQHLRVLRQAGLVQGEKRGYWTHYTVQRDVLKDLAASLNDMALQGVAGHGGCGAGGKRFQESGE